MKRLARKSKSGRGPVFIIVFFFLSSAVLRILAGAETAVAETAPAPELEASADGTGLITDEASLQEAGLLLKALQQREAAVAAREQEIAEKSKELSMLRAAVEEQIAILTTAETELRATLNIADQAAEKDVSHLTSVYENMKPKDAATLFEEMDPAFAVGFLSRMRPDAAAAIMSGLTPEKAYSISAILAGRHTDVPIQ